MLLLLTCTIIINMENYSVEGYVTQYNLLLPYPMDV